MKKLQNEHAGLKEIQESSEKQVAHLQKQLSELKQKLHESDTLKSELMANIQNLETQVTDSAKSAEKVLNFLIMAS